MAGYILFRDGEAIGHINDRALADYLDGQTVITDGMYEKSTYEAVPESNIDAP